MAVTFHIDLGTSVMDMDVINIYKSSSEGKLASLRSFWDGSKQG
jgi:hypothetical protein